MDDIRKSSDRPRQDQQPAAQSSTAADKKFRFFIIMPFSLPRDSQFLVNPTINIPSALPKEQRMMNYERVKHLLDDVEWDLHPGPPAPYGDWPVENREEFASVAAERLPLVREACETGKYNAVVLLGGGEPGYREAREIARQYGIPVTACASAQMHIACMLGNRFSVIDLAESHNMYYYDLVVQHRMTERCASIRNLNFPLPRPGTQSISHWQEIAKAARGEPSALLDAAVTEAVVAIEEDGAEVITFGCSVIFGLRPMLQQRLNEIGWDVPVLEGFSCAIALAKTMVSLGLDASGLTFPGDRPRKWRRKKTF